MAAQLLQARLERGDAAVEQGARTAISRGERRRRSPQLRARGAQVERLAARLARVVPARLAEADDQHHGQQHDSEDHEQAAHRSHKVAHRSAAAGCVSVRRGICFN